MQAILLALFDVLTKLAMGTADNKDILVETFLAIISSHYSPQHEEL